VAVQLYEEIRHRRCGQQASRLLLRELTLASPLRVEKLDFTWPGGSRALQNCNLELPRPGLWMLVGGNGSGKSTLLRLIAGLLEPGHGHIHCPVKAALVFQNPDHQLLLPSCATDLQLPLPEGLDQHQRQTRLAAALAQVGLAGFEQRPIHTLSGGQKQRSGHRRAPRQ